MDPVRELASLVEQLTGAMGDDEAWADGLAKVAAFLDAVIARSEQWPGTMPLSSFDAPLDRLLSARRAVEEGDRPRALAELSSGWLALERLSEKLH